MALLLAITAQLAYAEFFTGKVVRISDGDTVTVLVDTTQVNVRLDEIDVSERKQPSSSSL